MAIKVTTTQVDGLSDAMVELARVCRSASSRMADDGVSEFESSNYPSALRGFGLVLNFVEGFAGAASIAKSRGIIKPILIEMEEVRRLSREARNGDDNDC